MANVLYAGNHGTLTGYADPATGWVRRDERWAREFDGDGVVCCSRILADEEIAELAKESDL